MSVTCILMSDDDVVLAEYAMPQFAPTIRVAKPPRLMRQDILREWESDILGPLCRQIEFRYDPLDSLAHQLLRESPDVFVYRERVTA